MPAPDSSLLSRVDSEAFRAVMRRVPSPVTVVTATNGTAARGVTIGSFTSVSLDPPLVSFNLIRTSRMAGVLAGAERFVVHVMSDRQAALCDRFALPDLTPAEQFDGVPHRLDADGTPILEAAVARLACRIYAVHDAGDHLLLLGEVTQVSQGAEQEPIVYLNRAYRSVGAPVTVAQLKPVKRGSSGTS